jgi:putative membrane protein
MQLTEADRARIVAAIRAAEAQTAGEIYCVIARACSEYRFYPLAWAALIALAVPLPLVYLTQWSAAVIHVLQLIAFAVLFVGLARESIRRRIVPRRTKHDRAHAEALRQFAAHGLHRTERRTGVLIFVAVRERYAEILADAGIDQKVTPEIWDQAVAVLIRGIKQGRPADGFVAAIELCATVLAEHFPPGAINRDELPNAIVEL